VSQLYDLKIRVDERIKAGNLDGAEVRGRIGLKAGRLLAFISPSTPDDPASVAKLKLAIKEVLNINV
jgi:hypothetical protein